MIVPHRQDLTKLLQANGGDDLAGFWYRKSQQFSIYKKTRNENTSQITPAMGLRVN